MNSDLVPILELARAELVERLEQLGQPRMRARQIQRWLMAGRVETFEQMTDLPQTLRKELSAHFLPLGTRVARHLEAADQTHKLLLQLRDGQHLECVLIQEDKRRTACISTQVGCGMGCVFCASGLNGLVRNLTAGEILEQLIRLRNVGRREPAAPARDALAGAAGSARLTHIVVMGMGEPLANLDSLLSALEVAGDPEGLNIGARHVTISTVGLPAKIRRLADLGKQYHLAVSLHAPNDALRSRIVPTNPKTGLEEILSAAAYFFEKTGRQVTYEYVLLRDLNDRPEHARELARLLQQRRAHVNLIPFNDVEGLPYRRPDQETLTDFTTSLRNAGISVKVRKRKGSEIDAACGQLRRRVETPSNVLWRLPTITGEPNAAR